MDDYQPWESWNEQSRQDSTTRATKRWKQTLAAYEAPPLDAGIDDAQCDFVARKKSETEDAWY